MKLLENCLIIFFYALWIIILLIMHISFFCLDTLKTSKALMEYPVTVFHHRKTFLIPSKWILIINVSVLMGHHARPVVSLTFPYVNMVSFVLFLSNRTARLDWIIYFRFKIHLYFYHSLISTWLTIVIETLSMASVHPIQKNILSTWTYNRFVVFFSSKWVFF